MAMNDNREVTYEIVEEIGVLTAHQTGWNKEINMVSWNGNTAKYDIRDWSPDHAQMGRGITLHEKEMRMMLELLKRRPRSTRAARVESAAEDIRTAETEEASFMSVGDNDADRAEETAAEASAAEGTSAQAGSDEDFEAAAI